MDKTKLKSIKEREGKDVDAYPYVDALFPSAGSLDMHTSLA